MRTKRRLDPAGCCFLHPSTAWFETMDQFLSRVHLLPGIGRVLRNMLVYPPTFAGILHSAIASHLLNRFQLMPISFPP